MTLLASLILVTSFGASLTDKIHGNRGAYLGQYPSGTFDHIAADSNLGNIPTPAANSGADSIPGVPGANYPILADVPETEFSCDGKKEGGYYADPDTECQVFHVCRQGNNGSLSKYSFLCPNGTIFNQKYILCDWWFNFACSEAQSLYSTNEEKVAVDETIPYQPEKIFTTIPKSSFELSGLNLSKSKPSRPVSPQNIHDSFSSLPPPSLPNIGNPSPIINTQSNEYKSPIHTSSQLSSVYKPHINSHSLLQSDYNSQPSVAPSISSNYNSPYLASVSTSTSINSPKPVSSFAPSKFVPLSTSTTYGSPPHASTQGTSNHGSPFQVFNQHDTHDLILSSYKSPKTEGLPNLTIYDPSKPHSGSSKHKLSSIIGGHPSPKTSSAGINSSPHKLIQKSFGHGSHFQTTKVSSNYGLTASSSSSEYGVSTPAPTITKYDPLSFVPKKVSHKHGSPEFVYSQLSNKFNPPAFSKFNFSDITSVSSKPSQVPLGYNLPIPTSQLQSEYDSVNVFPSRPDSSKKTAQLSSKYSYPTSSSLPLNIGSLDSVQAFSHHGSSKTASQAYKENGSSVFASSSSAPDKYGSPNKIPFIYGSPKSQTSKISASSPISIYDSPSLITPSSENESLKTGSSHLYNEYDLPGSITFVNGRPNQVKAKVDPEFASPKAASSQFSNAYNIYPFRPTVVSSGNGLPFSSPSASAEYSSSSGHYNSPYSLPEPIFANYDSSAPESNPHSSKYSSLKPVSSYQDSSEDRPSTFTAYNSPFSASASISSEYGSPALVLKAAASIYGSPISFASSKEYDSFSSLLPSTSHSPSIAHQASSGFGSSPQSLPSSDYVHPK